MIRGDEGLKTMKTGEFYSIIPIKWIMRGNTSATYQRKRSKARRGVKSCPFQKQGLIVRQIKYIFAENIRF